MESAVGNAFETEGMLLVETQAADGPKNLGVRLGDVFEGRFDDEGGRGFGSDGETRADDGRVVLGELHSEFAVNGPTGVDGAFVVPARAVVGEMPVGQARARLAIDVGADFPDGAEDEV